MSIPAEKAAILAEAAPLAARRLARLSRTCADRQVADTAAILLIERLGALAVYVDDDLPLEVIAACLERAAKQRLDG